VGTKRIDYKSQASLSSHKTDRIDTHSKYQILGAPLPTPLYPSMTREIWRWRMNLFEGWSKSFAIQYDTQLTQAKQLYYFLMYSNHPSYQCICYICTVHLSKSSWIPVNYNSWGMLSRYDSGACLNSSSSQNLVPRVYFFKTPHLTVFPPNSTFCVAPRVHNYKPSLSNDIKPFLNSKCLAQSIPFKSVTDKQKTSAACGCEARAPLYSPW